MQNRQQRTLNAFQQVLIYLDEEPIESPPPLLERMRGSLEASISRIMALDAEQRDAKQQMGGHVAKRVTDLRRQYMMPIVRVAKPLLSYAPGVEKHLRVPHARSDAYTVAKAALDMANALVPHQKLLTSAGFTKDVMQDFRQRARELALATKKSRSAREQRSIATAKIAEEFKKAMATLEVIEGMVMRDAHASGRRIDYWKDSRRVSKRIGRPKRRGSAPAVRSVPSSYDT